MWRAPRLNRNEWRTVSRKLCLGSLWEASNCLPFRDRAWRSSFLQLDFFPRVEFELERGMKGMNAVQVKIVDLVAKKAKQEAERAAQEAEEAEGDKEEENKSEEE